MPRSTPHSSLSFGQKLLAVASVLLSPLYLLPLMFLVGAVASFAIWDEMVAARTAQRGWFVVWLAGLVLVALGACYTFVVLPRLPSILTPSCRETRLRPGPGEASGRSLDYRSVYRVAANPVNASRCSADVHLLCCRRRQVQRFARPGRVGASFTDRTARPGTPATPRERRRGGR